MGQSATFPPIWTVNGEKLSIGQVEPVQAINSAVAKFISISYIHKTSPYFQYRSLGSYSLELYGKIDV